MLSRNAYYIKDTIKKDTKYTLAKERKILRKEVFLKTKISREAKRDRHGLEGRIPNFSKRVDGLVIRNRPVLLDTDE